MTLLILKIAGAIVLARLAWAILPVVVGWLFTAALAILAPVTALRYSIDKKTAVAPPVAALEPFNANAVVAKYMAEYRKQDGIANEVSIKATNESGSFS
jgi:hypothetical protein